MLNRRLMLGGLAASGLLSTGRISAQSAPYSRSAVLAAALRREDSLAAAAARRGLLFGTEIGRGFFEDPSYMHVVSSECSLVCATLLSAGVTRHSQAGFMFSGADQEINFAGRHQLAVDGGYLIVHGTEPAIIGGDTDRASALTELQLIVSTTMTRYAGKLDHWIVVNEPLSPTGFRKCRWLSTIGPDYVAEAFRAARQADPDAILVLNEDGLEDDSGTQKRATMLQLLATLKNGGVPLDALGLQAHLNPAHRIDRDVLNDFLSQVTSLGLKVIITELDVFDVSLPADESARDAMVAQHIGDFLEIVLPHPSLFAVNVWGLSDKYSWYNSPRTPAVLRRSDSLPSRGTLLDEQLNRKPAYYAVRRAFENSERS